MKRISILGMLAVIMAAPAMAAEPFPESGSMQAEKEYEKSCNSDVLGVYNGTTNMIAEYTGMKFTIEPGKYLYIGGKDSNADPVKKDCPEGSYCAGSDGEVVYDEDTMGELNNYGITGACPDDFKFSAAGTTTANDCYRECTLDDVKNAIEVSGKYYAGGDNVNQCVATSCVEGYTLDDGQCSGNTITLNWEDAAEPGYAATCTYGGDLKTPAVAPIKKGYTFIGWKVAESE